VTADLAIDHLVYATPDLNRGIDEIESLLGVRPAIGGRHLGRGTHNALVALGESVYLEIIAPDPGQSDPPTPRAFGLDNLEKAQLVTWAAKSNDVESVRVAAETSGIFLGGIQQGSRQRPDGVTLSWRYTNPATVVADGLIPFFIDWGKSPNPAASAPQGARLVALRAEHPDATSVLRQLQRLGIEMRVSPGRQRALIATIDSPRGRVELR
jgi:glyoxalase-like protein